VQELVLPVENEKNVKEDVQEDLLGSIRVHYVKTIEEVLSLAFEGLELAPREDIMAGARTQ
jgi:ATP-dependent Lon protease